MTTTMEQIFKELSNDIQQDIFNLYYKEVPFKDEIKQFGKVLEDYKTIKEEYGEKGFLFEIPDDEHPLLNKIENYYNTNLMEMEEHHAILLFKMDRLKEGCNLRDSDIYDWYKYEKSDKFPYGTFGMVGAWSE